MGQHVHRSGCRCPATTRLAARVASAILALEIHCASPRRFREGERPCEP